MNTNPLTDQREPRQVITPRRSLSPKARFQILARDGFRCRYCGASPDQSELHVDHWVPLAMGGVDEFDNYVTSCVECNLGKGDTDYSGPLPQENAGRALSRLRTKQGLRCAYQVNRFDSHGIPSLEYLLIGRMTADDFMDVAERLRRDSRRIEAETWLLMDTAEYIRSNTADGGDVPTLADVAGR
ncbi:MAG: HNH endonuclease [Thermomicrobia bacterium]|nr:HNH endonuclease [Thermomicrobia bacterium]MCA1723022.1 HNH endonuclease [Thermomicrobia bacterium]